MKKILLAFFVFAMAISTETTAQYYQMNFINAGHNPGNLNNDDENPSGSLTPIGWTEIIPPTATDQWSGPQTIPFTFNFNGTNYTSIEASASGVVTFTSSPASTPGLVNATLPSTNIPDNSICVWGLNLTGTNDAVLTKTFGTAPNRQFWIFWASASSPTLGTGSAWAYWSIVLEETSNKVYIVDQRNYSQAGGNVALTAGLQYTSSTAIMIAPSPALGSFNTATGGNVSDPSDNTYYMFGQGTMPDYDVTVNGLDLPTSYQIGTGGVAVTASITNIASQTITSLDVEYTVNGGPAISGVIPGLNITTGSSANVAHPTFWVPTTSGTYTIDFTVTAINGNPDSDNGNNSASGTVLVYDQAYPRVVLYEMFTSSTCAPCLPGNQNFEGIMATVPDSQFASVKYQMNWPGNGDPYYTQDGAARQGPYYGVNSVPRLEIDGGWDDNSNSFLATNHTDAFAVPAFVKIDAEFTTDAATQTIQTCATIESIADLGPKTLYIAIIEGKTVLNVGTNGETEFFNVTKKMVPNANGQAVTITNGMNQTICASYTFNGDYRLPNDAGDMIDDAIEHSVEQFSDLKAVVWIQDDATLEVINSARAVNTKNCDVITISGTVVDNQPLGSITLSVTGGAAPNTFDWTGPNGFTSTSQDLTGLDEQGEYRVVLTDDNGCTETKKYTIGGIVTVNEIDVERLNAAIYPNPANNEVTISVAMEQNAELSIRVIDVVGKTVMFIPASRLQTGKNTIALNTTDLKAGVYYIELTAEGMSTTKQLIIQK